MCYEQAPNCNDVRGWDQLVQQLQSLRGKLHVQGNHAREIASRSAEAGDQTKLDRVAAGIEHDGVVVVAARAASTEAVSIATMTVT